MNRTDEIREFLVTRRARITPEQAGLLAYGTHRRVKGLRREEVAMMAGVSVDYYTRLERGNLAGASESVLDALVRALRLDDAERAHLFDLARTANASPGIARRRAGTQRVRPGVQRVLDALVRVLRLDDAERAHRRARYQRARPSALRTGVRRPDAAR